MKIVIDCANGANYKVAPETLWELGCEIIVIENNPNGLNIIHRLPVATSSGSSIVYYKSNFIDHNYQHLFPPMNLSHLTIHLYMDGQELPLENLTISFEFELVILNK